MPELFTSLPTLLSFVGVALIIIEILVLGFSSIFLIFVAAACFTAALLMALGLFEHSILNASVSVAIFSFVWALFLWKPLKTLQQRQQSPEDQPNSFSGVTFSLSDDLAPGSSIVHEYSGITWQVFLTADQSQVLVKGTEVQVVKSEVGKMYVKSISR
jgi:membrane protein implicated in regulation of membrane protease activity